MLDKIGVVGLGYVGLPLALSMCDAGYDVVGVDIDEDRIATLQDNKSYIDDVPDAVVRRQSERGFSFTTEYQALSDVTGVIVCVPTPLEKTRRPNLSYVVDATKRLAEVIPQECTVVLESTVYPAATSEVVAPLLTDNDWTIGQDIFVAYSPERIDPGNEQYDLTEIPKVLGGITPECSQRAEALYAPVFDTIVPVESATEAEFVKLLENVFRTVNIALINELATVAHELDVDIWEVIDAASTKPFGYMPFYPGPGLGGHCLPIDPLYLSWKANQHGIGVEFIELADEINRSMPNHVVSRIIDLLNQRGIPVLNADILVLGVAYKPDVSDVRESPAFDIMVALEERGASITYHDPHVPTFEVRDQIYESQDLTSELIESCDITVLVTDHGSIDVTNVANHAPLFFDTRNATSERNDEHIHRL